MKKALSLAVLLAALVTMPGCGAMIAMGGGGLFYQDTKTPHLAAAYYGPTANTQAKVGEASMQSILGIIVTGDASIQRAMQVGGITKIHHIDTQVTNILGIIGTYKVIVYGE